MRTLNLGILAHVDAGKTSLTERLLYGAGVVDDLGSVDDGSTQTDSLALERRRGITIRSAVISFVLDGVTVNLVDTPGHPDFIAEVERVLGVLDGAVLVVSAVEGVQAQTRILMRTLQRLHLPTLVFVNKIDRGGADHQRVLQEIAAKLSPAAVSMGSAHGLGTRSAVFTAAGAGDPEFAEHLVDVLARHDPELLAAWVHDEAAVGYPRLRAELADQTRRALVHPVFAGSAITGAGVDVLTAALTELLPANEGDGAAPVSGTVFKVERGPAGERIGWVRLFTGTVRTRDRLRTAPPTGPGPGPGTGPVREGRVTAIGVFEQGATVAATSVAAGRVAKMWGLVDARVGDAVGTRRPGPVHHFAPPTLQTVVDPARAADRGALRIALGRLAEQDPLIDLRQDAVHGELSVCLYGEVQKEVLASMLADDFGVAVTFRETTTICVEEVLGTGAAAETIGDGPNPFLAGIGLRVDAAPAGSGIAFGLVIELGSLPLSFLTAIEDTARRTLDEGLYGWQVPDAVVTLTHSAYWPRQSHAHAVFDRSMSSTAGDFRQLTPLVLMAALAAARTRVCEPVHRFRLEAPAETLGPVIAALGRLGGVPGTPVTTGTICMVEGLLPAAAVHALAQRLPGLTGGEGVVETAFHGYRPVTGASPTRPRTEPDALNRRGYLLQVTRGAAPGRG